MFLALDTSTLTLSLALVDREASGALRAVEVVTEGPPRKQSEMLPGVIAELLSRHGVALGSLEGLAVGLGPGSFTGLRIGVATVKALAYATRLKVTGVSSLAAVALEGPPSRPLIPCAVARIGELYVGRYRRTGEGVEQLGDEEALTPAELAERLKAEPEALALGPAIAEYRRVLEEAGVPAEQLSDAPRFPSAMCIAALATFPGRWDGQAIFGLEPHYVRASEAERNPRFPPLPGPAPGARLKED